MRCFKANSSEPSYGTYETTREYSKIERMNVFPYPFYFTSNPFSDEPSVDPRRAGWSAQITKPAPKFELDPYPDHCFQAPCNTVYSTERPPPPPAGSPPAPPVRNTKAKPPTAGAGSSGPCVNSRCINLYR